MTPSLESHALEDVNSIASFDDDDGSTFDLRHVSGAADAGMAAAVHSDLTNVPSGVNGSRPRHYQDIPLPPPERPLKWQTKLADWATAAVNLEARYKIPPQLLFDLLADPTQHDKIFDAILAADSELLEVDGPRRKWRLDYTARWNFWKVSGVCENRLFMWTDSEAGTVTFKLRQPGFLKRYEGTWTITSGSGQPLSAFAGSRDTAPAGGLAACGSIYDLRSCSRSGSGSSTSSLASSPRSTTSSWADGFATIDMFGGGSKRAGSDISSTSTTNSGNASVRPLPLATVSAVGSDRLHQTLSKTVSDTASKLGSIMSQTLWRRLTFPSSYRNDTGASCTTNSSPSNSWPALFKTKQPSSSHSFSRWSSLGSGVDAQQSTGAAGMPQSPQSRSAAFAPVQSMPMSALITASTLTSPKLTPPYPINQCLKAQSKNQVEEMLEGLVRAAAAAAQLPSQPLHAA